MDIFSVHYIITCYEGENIDQKLQWICLEQSVELPKEVVSAHILDLVTGQVQTIEQISDKQYKVTINWPVDNIGNDRTQFLNILYGNISLKQGIKITSVDWHPLKHMFNGAGFGIEGIREKFKLPGRPLACGVLKPMGSSTEELADMAREFALGGIDLIKDDHGLANQIYAPFQERVHQISETLQKVQMETGQATFYFPNITVSGSRLMEQYETAADLGADGVMVIPEICGYEAMAELADSKLDIPIIAHPAFSGTFVTDSEHGFTPSFLFGEMYRAFGADFSVYPNTGGRFSFTKEECHNINVATRKGGLPFKPIFPMPGGGMKRETIPHWISEYGNDTVFLLGASMLQHPGGIRKAAAEVQEVLKSHPI